MASLTGHGLYDVWNHRIRKPLFSSVETKTVTDVFKNSTLETGFENLLFGAWKRADARTHISVFKNIRVPVDRALETGFKIAELFTLLIWKNYQLKTEFQIKATLKIKLTCDWMLYIFEAEKSYSLRGT